MEYGIVFTPLGFQDFLVISEIIQLVGGNEIGTLHKRPEHAARLTQVYASNAAVTFVLIVLCM